MNVAADTDPLPFQPDTPFPSLLCALKGYSIVRMDPVSFGIIFFFDAVVACCPWLGPA